MHAPEQEKAEHQQSGRACLEKWYRENMDHTVTASELAQNIWSGAPLYQPQFTTLTPSPSSGVSSKMNRSITESGRLAPDAQTPASRERSDPEDDRERLDQKYPPRDSLQTLTEAVAEKRQRQLNQALGFESDEGSVLSAMSESSSHIPAPDPEEQGYEDIEAAMNKLAVDESAAVKSLGENSHATPEHIVEVYVKPLYSQLNIYLQQLQQHIINKPEHKDPVLTLCVQQLYEMYQLVSKSMPGELAPFVTPAVMKAAGHKDDINKPLLSSEQPYLVTIGGLSTALAKAYTRISKIGRRETKRYEEVGRAEKERAELLDAYKNVTDSLADK